MANIQRESMIFYRSFREAVKGLNPKEQLEFYNIVFDYGFLGKEPEKAECSPLVYSLFVLSKEYIDVDRWEQGNK